MSSISYHRGDRRIKGGFIKGNDVAIMGVISMDGLQTGQGQADVFLAP